MGAETLRVALCVCAFYLHTYKVPFIFLAPFSSLIRGLIRVFHHIKVIFKKILLVEYTSKFSSYEFFGYFSNTGEKYPKTLLI